MSNQSAMLHTNGGALAPYNQNLITADPCGPLLMQGHQIFKKLAHH